MICTKCDADLGNVEYGLCNECESVVSRESVIEDVLVMAAASLCPETHDKMEEAIKELCDAQHLNHVEIAAAASKRIEARIQGALDAAKQSA